MSTVPKTVVNDGDVEKFLSSVEPEQKRLDCFKLLEIFSSVTGEPAKMWGDAIVGFGTYHYTYASGRTGDWPVASFSPRKQSITLYVMPGFDEYADAAGYDPGEELKHLGPHTTSKACLYIKTLDGIDEKVLRRLIKKSVAAVKKMYG
jgi:hypothetical protein